MSAGCPEHVWRLTSMVCESDGTTVELTCERCGALTIQSPDDVAGRSG